MATENENGCAASKDKTSQLILTLDRASFGLTIGGATQNLDEALSILEMAHRIMEAKLRAAQIQQTLSGPAPGAFQLPRQRGH